MAEPGQGYVDEFTPDGALVAQVVNSGKKNAPLNAAWGLALAPADFGAFAGDLLVGNFGNGRISAYSKRDTKWVYRGPASPRRRNPDRDRWTLGDRVRQRRRRRPDERRSTSSPGRATKATASTDRSRPAEQKQRARCSTVHETHTVVPEPAPGDDTRGNRGNPSRVGSGGQAESLRHGAADAASTSRSSSAAAVAAASVEAQSCVREVEPGGGFDPSKN